MSELSSKEICRIVQSKGEYEVKLSRRDKRRVQNDWDRYYKYKAALSESKMVKGNTLMLWWLFNYLFTHWRYPRAAYVAEIYYDCWRWIEPVEFSATDENDNVSAIFRRSLKSV